PFASDRRLGNVIILMAVVPDHVTQKGLGFFFFEGCDWLGVVDVVQVADRKLPSTIEAVDIVACGRVGAGAFQLLPDCLAFFRWDSLNILGTLPWLIENVRNGATWFGAALEPSVQLQPLFSGLMAGGYSPQGVMVTMHNNLL